MASTVLGKTLRLLFVLAALVAMPVLAVPGVLERVEAWWSAMRGLPASEEDGVEDRHSVHAEPPAPAPDETLPAEERSTFRQETPPAKGGSSERFRYIQQRLKELGANYMLLEEVADQDGAFRFHCSVAVPGSRVYSRPFEAVDANRLRAMQRVLAEVETWQAAQTARRDSGDRSFYR